MDAVGVCKLVDGCSREVVLNESGHLDGCEKSLKSSNSAHHLAPRVPNGCASRDTQLTDIAANDTVGLYKEMS